MPLTILAQGLSVMAGTSRRKDAGTSLCYGAPESTWLPLMQFPKDEPEQCRRAARPRQGKILRFRQANQRDEDNAKGNDKSDRMARKAPRSIFSERERHLLDATHLRQGWAAQCKRS